MKKRVFFWGFLFAMGAAVQAQPAGDIRENLFLFNDESSGEKIAKNLFCRAEASRQTIYTGQPLVITLKLYSALQSYSVVEKTPGFNGFSTYDITTGREPSDEVVNGRLYRCHIIRKLQLYPLEAGIFTLEPVEVNNTITFHKVRRGSELNLEELLASSPEETFKYTARTNPLSITVKQLPEAGKPAGFNGANGRFLLEAACASSETDQYGALQVNFTLSGTGNFKMINELPVNWPPTTEAFEPDIQENIDENLSPFAGKKVFTYTISPATAGTLVIPAVSFYYFDPAKNAYQLTKSDSIRITVNKAAPPKTGAAVIPGTPIPANEGSMLWWYVAGGVLIIAVPCILYYRKRSKLNNPVMLPVTGTPVEEPVHTPFLLSKNLYMLGEQRQFFASLRRELTFEAALALGLPPEATARDIQRVLNGHDTAASFTQLVQELDDALYASGQTGQNPEQYLQQAIELVNKIKG